MRGHDAGSRGSAREAVMDAPPPACSLGTYLLVVLGFAISFSVLGILI